MTEEAASDVAVSRDEASDRNIRDTGVDDVPEVNMKEECDGDEPLLPCVTVSECVTIVPGGEERETSLDAVTDTVVSAAESVVIKDIVTTPVVGATSEDCASVALVATLVRSVGILDGNGRITEPEVSAATLDLSVDVTTSVLEKL